MRTVGEIVEAVQDNEPTTHEECRYALLAVGALHYFAQHALYRLATKPSELCTPELEWQEEWRRSKAFFAKDAKACVGEMRTLTTVVGDADVD